MTLFYVVAMMVEDKPLQRELIVDAMREGEWYSSATAAGATMDQLNCFILENIEDEAYTKGQFRLFGVHKFESVGLVTNYEV